MLIPFNHPTARGRVPVDPATGCVFQHVREIDLDAGLLVFYSTTLSHPDAKMAIGGREIDWYTFIHLTDPATGKKEYLTSTERCAFDFVDLKTGEVIREVSGPSCSPRFADPAAYWREENRRAGGVYGPPAPPDSNPQRTLSSEAEAYLKEHSPDHPVLKRAEMEALLGPEENSK